MNEVIKHKKGGQPGNDNAHKYGLYSCRFSPMPKSKLETYTGADPDPSVIDYAIKLTPAIEQNPDNSRVIDRAAKMLANYAKLKYGHRHIDVTEMEKGFRVVLQNVADRAKNRQNESASPTEVIGNY